MGEKITNILKYYKVTLVKIVKLRKRKRIKMAFPPSNKKLVITFVQSTVSGLLIALVLQSSPLAKSSKLQPNCNVPSTEFVSWAEFYPFYLCEHSLPLTKPLTKLFHFIATFNASIFLIMAINAKSKKIRCLLFGLFQGYGFAWISHFFVEQNRPATFKYPVYSFISDWVMFKDALFGRVSLF